MQERRRDSSQPASGGRAPQRVLIVSATMGEGHNATGRALEEAVRRLWPSATVTWLDTLDVMGPGIGPLFRWIYVTNAQHTARLYEFFYRALWHLRWFATAAKWFIGAWCGRRLARPVAEFAPDLVLSTYPMGTAGLAWLRRRGRLTAPIAAWVSDFAPHPFWVYSTIECNLVMHPAAVPLARHSAPGARIAVSAPPVRSAFRPGDRAAARRHCGLPDDAFIALVSCGALGFGDVADTVAELLDSHPDVVPVAVCGRNDALRRRLDEHAAREPRLRVLGWTDEMPALTVAADIVVSNAGGATGLEALACGRPVLMHRPIPAHGRANAELMAAAGLAVLCRDQGELADVVRSLVGEPERVTAMTDRIARHLASSDTLDDHLAALAAAPHRVSRRLRPEDALFAHVETPEVPQQVGTVLLFEPKPDGSGITRADAAYLMAAAPGVGVRLRPGTAWRRPAWQDAPDHDPDDVISELAVQGKLDDALGPVMDDFFGQGAGPELPCASLLVTDQTGRAALLIKTQHAVADGIAMIGTLVGRARGRPPLRPPSAAAPRSAHRLTLARGLWTLASAGRAPRTSLDGDVSQLGTSARHHGLAQLDGAAVRATARDLGAATTDVVLAALAGALHRVLGADAPERLRVMLPLSTRGTQTFRELGNHTGAVPVDLPTGAMDPSQRVAETSAAVRAQAGSGAPEAAGAVVRAIGVLPPWLHRGVARWMYHGRWFNLVASVLPGARSPVSLNGAPVPTVYPVLPLAPGAELAVGMMTWVGKVTVCVTATPRLSDVADRLAAAMEPAFTEISRARRR